MTNENHWASRYVLIESRDINHFESIALQGTRQALFGILQCIV